VDLSLRQEHLAGVPQRARMRAGRLDPVLVAVFAVAVSAAGAARPSLWFDEAATISASTRSLPQLWQLLHNIDAVHGLYYLLMHGWLLVFPASEFWLRLSSCLAVGGAAAGVVVLGRQLSTRSVAGCAGVVFTILPRITWAGIEARSYALSTLAAVWLTVLLVAAVRRRGTLLWCAYGAALVAAVVLNVFVVLIVPAHAVAVALLGRRRTVVAWSVAAAVALAALAPFLLYCRTQIAQVGWISPVGAGTIGQIAEQQYFDRSLPFAILAGVVLAVPVVLRGAGLIDPANRRLAVIALAWTALPTVALIAYSVLSSPIYYPRYLCYTTPAMALLLAVCIVAVARSRDRITAVIAALAVAATPNYLLAQRGPYKEGMDFSQVADVLAAHAAPGDCLILDNTTAWKPGPIRPITAARPSVYAKVVDLERGVRGRDRGWLFDTHIPIWSVADRVRQCTVLWTVSERDETLPDRQSGPALDPGPRLGRAPAYQVPEGFGFHIVDRWQFSFAQVTKSTR
jgi:mannosyltransferase